MRPNQQGILLATLVGSSQRVISECLQIHPQEFYRIFLKEKDTMCSFYYLWDFFFLPVSDFTVSSLLLFLSQKGLYLFHNFVSIVFLGTNFSPRVALGRSTSREQVLKYPTFKVTQGITCIIPRCKQCFFFLFYFLVEDVLPQRLNESHAILSMDIQ